MRARDRKIFLMALVAAFSALFLVSLAYAAGEQASPFTHKATVIAINPDAKTLTVRLFETDVSSDIRTKGELILSWNDMTKVALCDQSKSFSDIKVGDEVLVTYHEDMGNYYADSIDLSGGRKC